MGASLCSFFFVVDTSVSNIGYRNAKINEALNEGINLLKTYADKNSNRVIKIGILQLSTECCWVNPLGLEAVRECSFHGFQAGGVTNWGSTLEELTDKLSVKKFLCSYESLYRPTIIIITDGYSNDDWRTPLNGLNNNKWFSNSFKLAFAIGDNVDISMLSSIVGSEKAVIHTEEAGLKDNLLSRISLLFKYFYR